MQNALTVLLLLSLFIISPLETNPVNVSGKPGGSVTLKCELEDKEILYLDLIRQSRIIEVCPEENCRVNQQGSCDVIIKDLTLSDAGKYILLVYYRNDQKEVKKQIREYHLHIDDEMMVEMGKPLQLGVLWDNADKVETNSSGEWKEIWSRTRGILDDHVTDRDRNLTINSFTSSDAGTYRVLDEDGNLLITVRVKGSPGSGDQDKQGKDSEVHIEDWIMRFILCVVLVVLVVLVGVMVLMNKKTLTSEQERGTQCLPRGPNGINGQTFVSVFRGGITSALKLCTVKKLNK